MTTLAEVVHEFAEDMGLKESDAKLLIRKIQGAEPIPYDTVRCQKCDAAGARIVAGLGKYCAECEP